MGERRPWRRVQFDARRERPAQEKADPGPRYPSERFEA